MGGERANGARDGRPEEAVAGSAAHRRPSSTPLGRLFWFGALWLAGVITVSLVAWLIRALIMP